LKKFLWIIPIVIAVSVFSVAWNNFFVYDDFIWLYRARTFAQNWKQMFLPDVIYFDPLIYLMFLADYNIADLDARWYHAVDLTIHAINALLFYRFAKLLSGDEKASLYGSILFASSFAIADAVIWPSSRVDLVSVMFSLGTLIQFLKYLRTSNRKSLWLSCGLFILALGAKGTPVVMPFFLLWLIIQEEKQFRYLVNLIPFCIVTTLYFILIKLTMNQASLPLDRLHFNIGNFGLAFCALFIPEDIINNFDLIIIALLLFAVVSALGLPVYNLKTTVMLRRTGYCFLTLALLPVLVITDLKLVTKYSKHYLLLLSPSHRIYLASVGVALFGGGILRSIEALLNKNLPRYAIVVVVMLLSGIVIGNAILVRERNQLWKFVGVSSRAGVKGLLAYRNQVEEGSQIGLINFPGGRGFTTPMFKICVGVNNITMLQSVSTGMIQDPMVLQKAEESYLFVLGRDGQVYNKSQLFRQHLLLNRMVMRNPDRPEYASAFKTISSKLDQEIMDTLE
jgi:hypothetical protein